MKHFTWLIRRLLRDAFNARSDEQTPLTGLLRECCREWEYNAVERAVVARIVSRQRHADQPCEDLDPRVGFVLPVEHLEALAGATTEIGRAHV